MVYAFGRFLSKNKRQRREALTNAVAGVNTLNQLAELDNALKVQG